MLSFLTSVLFGAYLSNDNEESLFLLAVAIGNFVEAFRSFKLISGKRSILAFLHDLCSHSTSDNEEFVKINKKLKNFLNLMLGFVLVGVWAVSCAAIVPLVSNEKILVFSIAFPLDWKNDSFSFWIAYLYVIGGFFYGFVSFIFVIIIWYLMINCTIKYEILGNQLRRAGLRKDDEKSDVQPVLKTKAKTSKGDRQQLYHKDLIEAIESHRNIKRYYSIVTITLRCMTKSFQTSYVRMVDQLSEYFADAFFFQIGTSALCICGSIYSLVFVSLFP